MPPLKHLDPVFNRDKFLLRQKVLTLSEKYEVCDEEGNPILFVERPLHWAQNLLAILAGVVTATVLLILLIFLVSALPKSVQGVGLLVSLGVWLVGTSVVTIALSKKRHVTIYRDASKQDPLIKILQEKKFEFLTATFTVRDMQGDLAKFRKNYLYDFFRKRWECLEPNGSLICVAKEDSIMLSLARRLLGPMFGLLRTNFIICAGESDRQIGEFNRNFTLFDRYVLDMSADTGRLLDRRIAIALGVMLDTGERR